MPLPISHLHAMRRPATPCYKGFSSTKFWSLEESQRKVEMQGYAESRLRSVVADHLGVNPEDLRPEVSLTDDLAVDSLELGTARADRACRHGRGRHRVARGAVHPARRPRRRGD